MFEKRDSAKCNSEMRFGETGFSETGFARGGSGETRFGKSGFGGTEFDETCFLHVYTYFVCVWISYIYVFSYVLSIPYYVYIYAEIRMHSCKRN